MQVGEPAVNPLILLLDNSDLYNRSRAVEALNKIGDKRAIEPLKKKLNDPSKLVQVEAAAALHGMGQMNATDVILSALEDANIQTRRAATKAVWEIIDNPPQKFSQRWPHLHRRRHSPGRAYSSPRPQRCTPYISFSYILTIPFTAFSQLNSVFTRSIPASLIRTRASRLLNASSIASARAA